MKIIPIKPNTGGSYSPIQESSFIIPPVGTAQWPDDLETNTFYQCNGFVSLQINLKGAFPVVASYTVNVDAWEAWREEQQEVTPEEPQLDPVVALQQENKLLKAQIKAQADRQEFLEDCIAEMAVELYV